MTPDKSPPDEHYTALFAAEEEALAAGQLAETRCPPGIPHELQKRLEQDLACVQLLRQALHRSAASTPQASRHQANTMAEAPIQVAFAPGGAAPSPQSELQALLQKRLRFISLVVIAFFGYACFMFGLSLVRDFDLYIRYWGIAAPGLLMYLTLVLLGIVLWRKRPLSLGRLRAIELALFGLVLTSLALELVHYLFSSPQFPEAANWARTLEEDIYFLNLQSYYTTLPFFILIVCYATLIPSSWRRCTLVVGVMALTPLTISAAAGVWAVSSSPAFFLYYVLPMGITLAIAIALAAYGTHRIEILRQEAFEARKLGQYQLKQLLGSGGMGEVYLAEHRLLKQPCAIKLIRPERAGDSATLRRFEREVQATARLKHWNTVQIFDYGHAADGTFYYVMEYLPGLTLEQLVKEHGPLPPERAVYLLRQVCLALREAHAIGLIHRDLKPANIMICERGGVYDVVKLLDFGLVKAIGLDGQDERLTAEGVIAGTPTYMSPEQAVGIQALDPRSDIYSLGAVAYFLLTSQPPFPRTKALLTLVAHIHERARPLSEIRPELPADLERVILRCLEKNPAQRFPDVTSLQEALMACGCANEWNEERAARWWGTQKELGERVDESTVSALQLQVGG